MHISQLVQVERQLCQIFDLDSVVRRWMVDILGSVIPLFDGQVNCILAALCGSHLSLYPYKVKKQMQVVQSNIVILQINLVMILLRTNLTRFFHFTKPALSNLSSFKEVENILQKRLVSAIKAANAQTLRQYSLVDTIKEKLVVEPAPAKQIAERTVNVSIINSRSLQHRVVEVPLRNGLAKVNLVPEQFGFPFRKAEDMLVHFSEHRGAPNVEQLTEYSLDNRTLLLFNLPENITEQDIQVTIRENASKISIKYCVLGLPAYAKVEFESAEDLTKTLSKLENKKIEFGDRLAKIKSYKDAERLRLANRRMVIEIDENAKLENMVVDLSRFGRVLHLDWPIEAYMNPTVEDVKEFYRDSKELIKINRYEVDGNIESQYYPNLEIWSKNQDERQYSNIIDKAESLKEAYENRSRFARNINVYAGKEHQIILKNRGYCVVTYTTSEECQNLYFSEGANAKMQLVGEKEQFEYDPLFKKELLRQIDNEYLLGKKKDFGRKEAAKKRVDQQIVPNKDNYYAEEVAAEDYQSYYLLQKIIAHRYREEALSKTSDYSTVYKYLEHNNQFLDWEKHLKIMRQAKENQKTKTFDELAELELYGRVLPKDENIQRLKVESIKYKNPKEYDLIKQNNLMTSEQDFINKQTFYERQKIRNNRMADQNLGIDLKAEYERLLAGGAGGEEGEGAEGAGEAAVQSEPVETDGDNIGKAQFSTARPTFLYRKRTPEQIANYLRRYNQFVRNNIYEYMGVFHDKLIEEAVVGQPEILNPQSLKFLDGSSFLTEPEVLEVLQFRRDFNKAQDDYENYVYGSEFIKSSGLNLQSYHANLRDNRLEAIRHLVDLGVVEETRRVEGKEEELREKVNILNNDAADFGEQYRIETHNDANYLVKISKLEHLVPLDRIAHLESVVQEIDSSISREEAAVFEKHYRAMKETGVIPDEVRKVFGIEQQLSVAELMSEMGSVYKVSKKDLEMTERIRSYNKDQISSDINTQLKIERQRKNKRKLNSSDFVKDPSQIYVKDREGYFKVSRYRQI